jgi:hypothetical protein
MKTAMLFILAGCGVFVFVLIASESAPGDPWFIKAIIATVVGALPVAILFSIPGRIAVDSSGVRQRYWWRRDKFIPWKDFAEMMHNSGDGSTIVYGKFESAITFSPYLVDHQRFDREVMTYSRTTEIPVDL